MADEFGSKDLKPAYDKMRTMTVQEVIAEAQAVYDWRGEPPYETTAYKEDRRYSDQEEAALDAEAKILSDFVTHWLPYLKRKGNDTV